MTDKKKGKSKKDPDINELKRDLEVDDHTLSIDVVAHRYQTHPEKGLTSEKAAQLYALYGPNCLTPPPQKSELRKLFEQMTGGFSLLLIAGAILCYAANGALVAKVGNDAPLDNIYLGSVLLIVVILTGLFGYYQEHQSSAIMNSFKNLVPQNAVVVRDGAKTSLPATQVVLGDLIVVKAGDRIPADIRIVECNTFKVDNSSLTGEAEPQVRGTDCSHENPLETRNLAFFSTSAIEGTATGIAIKTGDGTVMGRIAYLATGLAPEVTPLHRELTHFVHIITGLACSFGLVFLILALAKGYDWLDVAIFVIGIIVANVPEGLLATVTVALSLTAKRMAQKNCLVKHLEAVETLGSTSTICSDKTGTLTQNRMTVAHLWFDNVIYEADTTEDQTGAGFDRSSPTFQLVWRVAALCNRAEFLSGQEHLPIVRRDCTGDASESALLKFVELTIGNINTIREKYPKRFEIPFNSVVKFQISIHECDFDDGTVRHLLVMKGAPERIFARCKWIMINGTKEPLDEAWKENFERAYVTLGGYGERVLGFCFQELDPYEHPIGKRFEALLAAEEHQDVANFEASSLTFAGLISLVDPPRAAVPDAVRKCRSAGIRVIMVTGDHPITAKAIAHQVGIISDGSKTIEELSAERDCEPRDIPISEAKAAVVSGTQLKAMKNEELDAVLQNHPEIVFARTSPQQKLNIVEACQRIGNIVAVTGDGVNDSPALKKADIGVAMGISGSDVTKNVADMILLDDNFATIVTGVEEGRKIFNNLKKTIAYILTSNIPELAPFLLFIVASVPLPLGTITCLFIDVGTDLWPAIALAYEKAEADIMMRKPRDAKRDRLVTDKLILSAYFCFGVMESFAGFFVYFTMLEEHGWRFERVFGLRAEWDDKSITDLQDSYGSEWTYNQRKDLEKMTQSAFFVAVVVMQWANLITVKTQRVSIFKHGMDNWPVNFGIFFETALAILLCYFFPLEKALNTRRFWVWYWAYAMPWSVALLLFDECRKWWVRKHRGGKLEMETCY